MTSTQIEKAGELLSRVMERERLENPGQCKMVSLGEQCACVLCLCDELRGLLRKQSPEAEYRTFTCQEGWHDRCSGQILVAGASGAAWICNCTCHPPQHCAAQDGKESKS
jgi:hypothetical protein